MHVMLCGMDIHELAEAVRKRRLDRGWSVEEAARRAGINRVTYKRIEDGLPVQDVKRRAVEALLGIGGPAAQLNSVNGGQVARSAAPDLNPELADFNDQELLDEVAGRMRLLAGRMQEATGADLLTVVVDPFGESTIVSHATKRQG